MREVYSFDRDWKFYPGEPEDTDLKSHSASYSLCKTGGAIGPAGKNYDDKDWQTVCVPHDYLAAADFSEEELLSHGYRVRKNAWYRKSFALPAELEGKTITLCFEGVSVYADFYFNGSLIAKSISAYTEITLDLTDRAFFGTSALNTIAVHIDGTSTEGWWYEGAGIYRHVKLYAFEPVHFAHNGVFVSCERLKSDKRQWKVNVAAETNNRSYVDNMAVVKAELFYKGSLFANFKSTPAKIPASSDRTVKFAAVVSDPKLWDVDHPNLYDVVITLSVNGQAVDEEKFRTGFRSFRYDAAKGFFLNDKPLKIKGTCNHQDHAGVGVAVPDSIQYYRVRLLKEMGSNAYRCSHNPPAKEILDACDELGMIVMDENRRFETGDQFVRNLQTLIKRDRNHPSVIFWSLFNEEPVQNTELGARIFRRLKTEVKKLDDTRLITGAINGSMEGAGLEMDVTGINYNIGNISVFHKKYPDQPIIGSENNSAVTTRGCYKTDNDKHELAGYDDETVPWGQTVRETWDFVRKNDYFGGIFIWTGFDYRGEPTPYEWPSVSSQFGILDTCGFKKDSFYFNKACFTDKPTIHVMPHWNWTEGQTVKVAAPTNCNEAELILNGVSLGKKPCDCIRTPVWKVKFQPGTLEVAGYINGKKVASDSVTTAGEAVKIIAEADKTTLIADDCDAAVVNVSLADENGVFVPESAQEITFETTGDIYVRGVGNGDPNSHEPDSANYRKLYKGRCQAIISAKCGGKSGTLIVKADGVESAKIDYELLESDEKNIAGAKSGTISEMTMSAITLEKPDPLVKIADNDMNSFTPVSCIGSHQNDFHNGWRIYRFHANLPENCRYGFTFLNFVSDHTEVYVDGKQVFATDEKFGYFYGGVQRVSFSFEAQPNDNAEFRILLHETDAGYGGMRDGVDLITVCKD